jgi:hypothetical protein
MIVWYLLDDGDQLAHARVGQFGGRELEAAEMMQAQVGGARVRVARVCEEGQRGSAMLSEGKGSGRGGGGV